MFLRCCGRVGEAELAGLLQPQDAHVLESGMAGLEEDIQDSLWLEDELASPEEEVKGLGVPVLEAGLEVEAPDSLGLKAELAAPKDEVEVLFASVIEGEVAGLEVKVNNSHGL